MIHKALGCLLRNIFKLQATDILVLQKLSMYGSSVRGMEMTFIQQSIFVGEIIKHPTNIKSLSFPLRGKMCLNGPCINQFSCLRWRRSTDMRIGLEIHASHIPGDL